MSANDGAVNEQVFEVWISGTKLMQLLEDAGFCPSGKAFIDGIPVPYSFGSSRHCAPEREIQRTAERKRRHRHCAPM